MIDTVLFIIIIFLFVLSFNMCICYVITKNSTVRKITTNVYVNSTPLDIESIEPVIINSRAL